MGSGWVPWMLALLVNVTGLDSSMTQGRDSPGKSRAIFSQVCMQELAWRMDAFPCRSRLQPRLELASGFKVLFLLKFRYAFPLYHTQWTAGKREHPAAEPQLQGVG